ncbi:MAG: acyloxyacyl hydrolase [Thermodesulfovibrionales bacterium]
MHKHIRYRFFFAMLLSMLFSVSAAFAQSSETSGILTAKSQWGVSGGYGTTHPGLGATETRVQTVDVILKYGYFLSEEVGQSWYRGRHELLIELPVNYVVSPETTPMIGITFLACWNFTALKTVVPYVFGGGGAVYTDLHVAELGRRLNGTHQVGFGLSYAIAKNTSIDFSYRFHHISNANTAKPNGPLNSSKVLVGLSFFQ